MATRSSNNLSDEQLKLKLQGMDDYDFEHFVADLWERQGWDAEVKQQSVDRGVDIVATRNDPFPQKWLIQAKCYSGTIGGPDVRQYVSLQHRQGVDGAIVVSTGPFSRQARQEEEEHNLKLIDGDSLVSLIHSTDSYDLVDRYVTLGREVKGTSTGHTENQLVQAPTSESSDSANSTSQQQTETRLQKYLNYVQSGEDIERGLNGLRRVLVEKPPRTIWWKLATVSTGFWILVLFIGPPLEGTILSGITTLMLFVAWFGLPIGIYIDSKIAPKYTVGWHPTRWAYILGAALPMGGFVAGPLYLGRRWWYGNNKELDDIEDFRRSVEQAYTLLQDADDDIFSRSDAVAGTNHSPTIAGIESDSVTNVNKTISDENMEQVRVQSVNEYEKHARFIQLLDNSDPILKTTPVKSYLQYITKAIETGDFSSDEYTRRRVNLAEEISRSQSQLNTYRNQELSKEFGETNKLFREYVELTQEILLQLESVVESVENGGVPIEGIQQIADNMHALSRRNSHLSNRIEEDIEKIQTLAENL